MFNNLPIKKVASAEFKRIWHKRRILNLMHEHGQITARILSKWLKISLPGCLSLLNELISERYVKNFGTGDSGGGNKPCLYGLPEDDFYLLVCDFSRFSANMAILNSYHKFITPITTIDTHIDDPFVIDKLHQTAQKIIQDHSIPTEKLYGIGVDMPGLINYKTGINYTIKDKRRQNIRHELEIRFNKSVYVENDARMHAYGELYFGAATAFKDVIIIHWNWGLGLGIIVNGKLCSGKNGFSGEFSHIPIVENGELCICGKRGCLETLASSNTVIRKVQLGIKANVVTSLATQFKGYPEKITTEDVINSARQGDEFCISVLNEIGAAMGKGLSYIIQLLNPEAIVLSGPLSKAKQYILSPIQQSLNRFCLEKISESTKILISDLGDQSAMLGTSKMIFQKIFDEIKFE